MPSMELLLEYDYTLLKIQWFRHIAALSQSICVGENHWTLNLSVQLFWLMPVASFLVDSYMDWSLTDQLLRPEGLKSSGIHLATWWQWLFQVIDQLKGTCHVQIFSLNNLRDNDMWPYGRYLPTDWSDEKNLACRFSHWTWQKVPCIQAKTGIFSELHNARDLERVRTATPGLATWPL